MLTLLGYKSRYVMDALATAATMLQWGEQPKH
jgi:hypothetical protein